MQQEMESNIRAGMTPEEAKFAAQHLVGSIALYKEECRDARRVSLVETFVRDLKYALRMLLRSPLFTVVAFGTLDVEIGANTTVFTFVEHAAAAAADRGTRPGGRSHLGQDREHVLPELPGFSRSQPGVHAISGM